MNNTLIVKIAVGTATALAVGYVAIHSKSDMDYLAERYPEIDRKIAKKAHNNLMSLAFRQKLDMTNWGEEKYNQLFLQEVARLTTEK